mgnify:CR=1 FL=1
MWNRLVSTLAMAMLTAIVLVVLLSWLLAAMSVGEALEPSVGEALEPSVGEALEPSGGDFRSLLSSEGIRFFLGGFVDAMRKPLLVWILLLAMAWGAVRESGLRQLFVPAQRKGMPLRLTLLVASVLTFAVLIALLTALPHAVLLSATGRLWPSPFSRALVPLVALWLIVTAVAHGILSRRFLSFTDVCKALSSGIASSASLMLLYVLAVQLSEALRFVFP